MESNFFINQFRENVRLFPQKIALLIGEKKYSYEDLFRKAVQISSKFSEKKSNSDLIGVYTDNNFYTYSAILAANLSGKAFVPINSKFPDDRIARMFQDLNLDFVCCTKASKSRVEQVNNMCPLLLTDEVYDDSNMVIFDEKIISLDAVAYILFTSGSTGEPKCIPITFNNLWSVVEASNQRWTICNDDVVLQSFELSFDISIGVIFMTWFNGGALAITSFEGITAINSYQTILDHQVTFAVLPPSSISYLKNYRLLRDVKVPSVKTTLFIGEALLFDHVNSWLEGAINTKIINTYGPTEATVWCFAYDINNDTKEHIVNGVCPIGKPMWSTKYMIDKSIGHLDNEGELCLSGHQVFNGYINNPKKNNETLFSDQEGNAWYRTGDIVYENEIGDIVYINRIDNQVKINGYRVELGEVEHAVRELLGITKVFAYTSQFNSNTIINCVIEGEGFDQNELHKKISYRLPKYMLPRNFYFFKTFPLNNSGKVDRNKIKSIIENGN
jgi:D-alanine--poly(phosphoribitol) ligase subunit 1